MAFIQRPFQIFALCEAGTLNTALRSRFGGLILYFYPVYLSASNCDAQEWLIQFV